MRHATKGSDPFIRHATKGSDPFVRHAMKGSDPLGGGEVGAGPTRWGMPRRPREEEPGAIHHVYARGNDKRLIYADDRDRDIYLVTLADVVETQEWLLLAYCLMDNHVHLLVET